MKKHAIGLSPPFWYYLFSSWPWHLRQQVHYEDRLWILAHRRMGDNRILIVSLASRVARMIAVIVALFAFFILVVVTELLPNVPKAGPSTDAPEQTDDYQPVPLAGVTTYWQQDRPGWWRLWNYDRKNLALVAKLDDYVLWHVFTSELWPSNEGYQVIELEDLLQAGIRAISPHHLTPTIEGRTGSVTEARTQVETTIAYIHSNVCGIISSI